MYKRQLFNLQIEAKLVRDRNWIEYSVYPLYSPQSFLAEGSANYGIDLAFPGDERIAVCLLYTSRCV